MREFDVSDRYISRLFYKPHRWSIFLNNKLLEELDPDFSQPPSLNHWSAVCRRCADKWYYDPSTGDRLCLNDGERFMLMVSEISEAMEGKRKDLQDDKLPHRKMVEVELADLLIRVFDYAGEHNLDLDGAIREKLDYNAHREDHTHEARLADGGKKW